MAIFTGKILTRKLQNGTILKGRIAETEIYLDVEHKATSANYTKKVTPREIPMSLSPGIIHVHTGDMKDYFYISSQGI